MKKLSIYLLLLFVLGCKKEDEPYSDPSLKCFLVELKGKRAVDGTYTYLYEDSLLVAQTYNNSSIWRFVYDTKGAIISTSSYVKNYNVLYNKKGLIIAVFSSTKDSLTYEYDADNRLIKYTNKRDTPSYSIIKWTGNNVKEYTRYVLNGSTLKYDLKDSMVMTYDNKRNPLLFLKNTPLQNYVNVSENNRLTVEGTSNYSFSYKYNAQEYPVESNYDFYNYSCN